MSAARRWARHAGGGYHENRDGKTANRTDRVSAGIASGFGQAAETHLAAMVGKCPAGCGLVGWLARSAEGLGGRMDGSTLLLFSTWCAFWPPGGPRQFAVGTSTRAVVPAGRVAE